MGASKNVRNCDDTRLDDVLLICGCTEIDFVYCDFAVLCLRFRIGGPTKLYLTWYVKKLPHNDKGSEMLNIREKTNYLEAAKVIHRKTKNVLTKSR